MRKTTFILAAFLILGSLAFGADTADLTLNTTIEANSALTVNGGAASTTIVPGTPATVNYTYVGNSLVKLTVDSANGMQLRHSTYATHNTWVIPYAMTLDYGSGTQTSVSDSVAVNLVDTTGTYDLAKTMVISAAAGTYAAGAYSDTLTFTITAQ